MDRPLRGHDRHERLLVAEHQRLVGDERVALRLLALEPDLRVHARQERAVGVGQLDLGQHRARRRVERLGEARDPPLEHPARELVEGDQRGVPQPHKRRVRLGGVDVDAEPVDPGQDQHRRRRRGRAGGGRRHEKARVVVARDHDARERRPELLVADHDPGPLEVGLGHQELRLRLVGNLLGDGVVPDEVLVAVVRDLGDVVIGLRRAVVLLGLGVLEDAEQLARLHPVPLVDMELPQVAGDLGVDRRLEVGADVAGQQHLERLTRHLRLDHADRQSRADLAGDRPLLRLQPLLARR